MRVEQGSKRYAYPQPHIYAQTLVTSTVALAAVVVEHELVRHELGSSPRSPLRQPHRGELLALEQGQSKLDPSHHRPLQGVLDLLNRVHHQGRDRLDSREAQVLGPRPWTPDPWLLVLPGARPRAGEPGRMPVPYRTCHRTCSAQVLHRAVNRRESACAPWPWRRASREVSPVLLVTIFL